MGDGESAAEFFRERWRRLVAVSSGEGEQGGGTTGSAKERMVPPPPQTMTGLDLDAPRPTADNTNMGDFSSAAPLYGPGSSGAPRPGFGSAAYHGHQQQQQQQQAGSSGGGVPSITNPHSLIPPGPSYPSSSSSIGEFPLPSNTADWSSSDARSLGPGFGAWLFADADAYADADPLSVDAFANMDVDAAADLGGMDVDDSGGGGGGGSGNGSEEIDWNSWVESAKGVGWLGESSAGGHWGLS